MYDDILVPTEDSESIEPVIEHSVDIASRRDATIHALYVIDDRSFLTLQKDMIDDVTDELRAEGEQATATVAERAESAGVDVVTDIEKGDPAEAIMEYVADNDIDLITMGTHDERDYQRQMLGSVSQKVVNIAPVPVLTVNVANASD